MPAPQSLLFVTLGTLGDLYPILAVATAWRRRGYQAAIAASPEHRDRVEAAGFPFYPVAPARTDIDPDTYRRTFDVRRGTEVLFREILIPHLTTSYVDVERAIKAEQPDGLVANDVALAATVAADVYGLPWAAAVLQPGSFLSAYDPPTSPAVPWLTSLAKLSPHLVRIVYRLTGWLTRPWKRPVRTLRRALGVPTHVQPVFREKYAADLALALFSRILGPPQPDWPTPTAPCGFPFYDEAAATGRDLPRTLHRFLEAGPPPVVFTLGGSVAQRAGDFFETSLAAAQRPDARAVLITGEDDHPMLSASDLPSSVYVTAYAPYGPLFERSKAVVHPGGIGTVGLALRAGVPQLVVPHMHDQPDNAARVVRAGAGLTLAPDAYTPDAAADALCTLLTDASILRTARGAATIVRSEPGAEMACTALENMLQQRPAGVRR